MTRRTKITLLTTSIVLVILTVTANIIIAYGLTPAVRKMLPQIQKTTGISLDFDRISFTLPRGILGLTGFRVSNPDGFGSSDPCLLSLDRATMNVGLLAALRGVTSLSSVRVRDSKVTVIRNEHGLINAASLGTKTDEKQGKPASRHGHTSRDRGTTEEPAPSGTGQDRQEDTKQDAKQPAQEPMPKLVAQNVNINTILEYVDLKTSNSNARIALDLKLKADDISTYGDPEKENGTLSLKGNIKDKPRSFVIDLKGKCAPLINPQKPTFEFSGTITNICTKDFKELSDALGIESERIDLDVSVKCREGEFAHGVSVVKAKITNLKVTGANAGKARGMSISSLSVSVPLKGTVDKPDFDFFGTLIGSILGNVDGIIKSIHVDQKSIEKKINGFFDSILGGKKKK
jgi:hypothetical protein